MMSMEQNEIAAAIIQAADLLGVNKANTRMGAIEILAGTSKDNAETLAGAIETYGSVVEHNGREVSEALDRIADSIFKLAKVVEAGMQR
jgi:lipopolysaccharide biosynthesis regulator YciM